MRHRVHHKQVVVRRHRRQAIMRGPPRLQPAKKYPAIKGGAKLSAM